MKVHVIHPRVLVMLMAMGLLGGALVPQIFAQTFGLPGNELVTTILDPIEPGSFNQASLLGTTWESRPSELLELQDPSLATKQVLRLVLQPRETRNLIFAQPRPVASRLKLLGLWARCDTPLAVQAYGELRGPGGLPYTSMLMDINHYWYSTHVDTTWALPLESGLTLRNLVLTNNGFSPVVVWIDSMVAVHGGAEPPDLDAMVGGW